MAWAYYTIHVYKGLLLQISRYKSSSCLTRKIISWSTFFLVPITAANRATDLVKSAQSPLELVAETVDRSDKRSKLGKTETLPDAKDKINQVCMPLRGTIGRGAAAAATFLNDYVGKFRFLVKSQSQLPSLAVVVVAFILLLMQVQTF